MHRGLLEGGLFSSLFPSNFFTNMRLGFRARSPRREKATRSAPGFLRRFLPAEGDSFSGRAHDSLLRLARLHFLFEKMRADYR